MKQSYKCGGANRNFKFISLKGPELCIIERTQGEYFKVDSSICLTEGLRWINQHTILANLTQKLDKDNIDMGII